MIVVTRETVWNPSALETRTLPKRIFGRVMLLPRQKIGARDLARLVFEVQPLRYVVALSPFVIAMFVWPEFALPIAQAPLAMILVLWFVEMRMLRLKPEDRAAEVSEDVAAQRLDLLAFRARACLRRIAAARQIEDGELRLVIEQSEMARIAPLTLVSVQTASPAAHLLYLDSDDRAALTQGLFDTDLTERDLQQVNQRQNTFLRDVRIEARSVSGHARMAAWIARSDQSALAEPAG